MYLISLREFPAGGGAYWLQPGRVDIEQVEGLGLGRGWGGYQGKAVSIIERRGHLVEGAGGKVTQQALEAMDWAAMGGEFAGALAQRARRGLGGSDDRGALAGRGSGIVVVEEDGFEALAHVPFDMAGEHAQEDMGAHPRRQPVMDRAEVQVDGLQAAKGALDAGEALIRANHVIGGQDVILDAGADDIKAVEPSLVGDAGRVAAKGETVFGNGDVEQLGELVAVFDTTNGTRDLVLTGGAAAAGDLVGQLAQRRLGGLQQILALAGPFLGQERVLADHEPLAGKLGCGDLSQIAFVEQRQLEGAGVEQGADLRGSERGDPVEPGRPQLVADAGAGDHAAVADQHDARQAKALFELVDLHRQCHRVGGIALEHFDRYRTAIGRTQQAVDNLQLALLAVTGIAKARQRAAPSLHPRRGEGIENERPLFEMAGGEPGRDRGLACPEPVEGAVELDFVDRAEPEQADPGSSRQCRRCGDGDAPLQQSAKTFDQRGGPIRQAGQSALLNPAISWVEGRCCALARFGYSRDGKKGKLQIVYGLLCAADGCPVAVEVFEGNTADPMTLSVQIDKLKERFGLSRVVLVGDRGMITSARIRDELRPAGLDWITALRAPQIRALLDAGAFQLSLFDERDLAEITTPEFPGERLVVCKNPLLAEERARKREDLLQATEAALRDQI